MRERGQGRAFGSPLVHDPGEGRHHGRQGDHIEVLHAPPGGRGDNAVDGELDRAKTDCYRHGYQRRDGCDLEQGMRFGQPSVDNQRVCDRGGADADPHQHGPVGDPFRHRKDRRLVDAEPGEKHAESKRNSRRPEDPVLRGCLGPAASTLLTSVTGVSCLHFALRERCNPPVREAKQAGSRNWGGDTASGA